MKTQKLNLGQIKVESFVTNLTSTEKATVNGGYLWSLFSCPVEPKPLQGEITYRCNVPTGTCQQSLGAPAICG